MDYRVTGLAPDTFEHLFGLSDADLRQHGAMRCVVDKNPGFPDRIEMRDGAVGETMLLLNHVSQPADTPYRASHAIFVREGASQQYSALNQVPDVMGRRLLSLRAFDRAGLILDADVVEGRAAEQVIRRFFTDPAVSYIHAHNAARGCYAGRIDRA